MARKKGETLTISGAPTSYYVFYGILIDSPFKLTESSQEREGTLKINANKKKKGSIWLSLGSQTPQLAARST